MHTYADIHTHASCNVVWESLKVAHNNPSQCPAVPDSVQSSSATKFSCGMKECLGVVLMKKSLEKIFMKEQHWCMAIINLWVAFSF